MFPSPAAASRYASCRRNGLSQKAVALFLVCWLALMDCFVPVAASAWWGEFTVKDEQELGRKFNVLIRSRMPLVQDPEVVSYLEDIVARLNKQVPPQPFPFTISVLRHNAINAFASPGGYLFIHTGLILGMNHESELAAVIAHEMAHVTQRHIAQRIEQGQIIGLLSALGALAGAFLGGGDAKGAAMAGSLAAGQSAMLKYSRTNENEADQVGLNYLIKAGYNPRGMPEAFSILSRRQWLMGSEIPSYLSTHPGLTDRIRETGNRIDAMPSSITARKDDDTRFIRVQSLVRARYSDPEVAAQAFALQAEGPQKCMALMGEGILAARLNRVNDAAADFDAALACSPKDPLILREAGAFHYAKGDTARGALLLRQALTLDRKDIMAQYFYGRSLADSGRPDQAIDYFLEVLRAVPEDTEIHEYLARFYARTEQMFKANLHMAYSFLYANNQKKITQFREKAKALAVDQEEKRALKRFDEQYKERKEFW